MHDDDTTCLRMILSAVSPYMYSHPVAFLCELGFMKFHLILETRLVFGDCALERQKSMGTHAFYTSTGGGLRLRRDARPRSAASNPKKKPCKWKQMDAKCTLCEEIGTRKH